MSTKRERLYAAARKVGEAQRELNGILLEDEVNDGSISVESVSYIGGIVSVMTLTNANLLHIIEGIE